MPAQLCSHTSGHVCPYTSLETGWAAALLLEPVLAVLLVHVLVHCIGECAHVPFLVFVNPPWVCLCFVPPQDAAQDAGRKRSIRPRTRS